MLPININDIVRVKLTEKGKRVYRDHIGLYNLFDKSKEGILETELWDIAKIFGPMFYVGAEAVFENNEILVKEYENGHL